MNSKDFTPCILCGKKIALYKHCMCKKCYDSFVGDKKK